jgi:hypothetical protein
VYTFWLLDKMSVLVLILCSTTCRLLRPFQNEMTFPPTALPLPTPCTSGYTACFARASLRACQSIYSPETCPRARSQYCMQ